MAQYSPNRLGFALVILLVLQLTHAVDKCKTGCHGTAGALKLTPGTTYKYDYDGKITILLSSAENQQTTTEVKATVLLTQQAECSQALKIQNIQVIGPDGKKRTGIPDMDRPVLLNNNNGALNEFMCVEHEDSQNSLNIKRAIASMFQVFEGKSSEYDVFGHCPYQISSTKDGDVLTITKNKNLNKCAFRESITHHYITSTFDVKSEIHSSPILNAYLDSKQKIKAGVLESATIVENYLFVPFSVGQNGAKANIHSKLTLTGTSKDAVTHKCQTPRSIIFENPHPVNNIKNNVNIILKKVKEIAEHLESNVVDVTATHFVDSVKLLRVSKKVDILSVYNQVRSGVGFTDKEAAKKIFLDAILVAGTGDNIEVAIELLKNKELGQFEERQLYLGLSHARHVTENSIKTATDLLNRPNLPREAFLGIGSLAGRYCATHPCEKVEVINKIIQKMLSKLGDLKAANRKEESDMIYVLKGLANIDYLNDAILSKLVSLAEDKKQPTRLRVATLEAFLASPCKDKFRDSALKTLKDIQQDSEVRIKAYLVLTRCPTAKIGAAIKTLLDEEKSNQVGGFITTHIKNLRASANPDKNLAKTHLGFIHTTNKFAFDPRKYSFNGEFSSSFETLGMANNIEGNVIYSQNSWMPRSANLNLTAEVFGQRFNFLEIAARQENLDKVIEHYLGPQGILRKSTLQQSWDHSVKPVENLIKNLKEKVDKSLRARRDVSKTQIDEINKKIQFKTNELDKNLDLDLSIKNFGYEIMFMNSYESTEKLTPQKIIDSMIAKLNEGLDKLKNFEKIFRSNLLFLDAELSYPTSLGFPLRLGIDGASNIQIKAEGNIDARQLLSKSNEKDVNLRISLIPSATVTVTGRLSLDTPLLENGLKVSSTLHTSSGGELTVDTFKEGFGLDVKFKFPVQKQEIIGLKHNIIFQTRENGAILNNQRLKFSQNKDFSICIDQLVNYVGLEFCADINGPNLSGKKVPILPFPFSGDAKASVRIEGGEINTFHYKREFFATKEGKIGVAATLETLDKNNKKGVSLDVEGYISPDKYIKATLVSPIKNAEAEARLVLNDKEKVLAVYVKDETKYYSAKAGLKVDGTSDKTIYKPILEYTTPESKTPQIPAVHVEGKVIAEKHGSDVKYIFDNVKVVIPKRKSITVSGNVGTEGPAYFTDITATDGTLSASVKGRIQAQPDLFKIQAELKNTVNPALNFNVKGEFKKQKEPEFVSSNLQITHGEDLNSKTNVITLINSFSSKNPKDPEISTKNLFSYPLMKISAKFDLDRTPKSIDYDTYVQYSDFKLGSEMKLKHDSKTKGDYQLEFDVTGMKSKVELKSSRQSVGADDWKVDHSLSVNGKKLEVSGKVKHHVKPNDLVHSADLTIKIPTSKTPWKLNEGIKLNPREIDFHVKLVTGTTNLIDTVFKGNRAGNANGHLKVTLKDLLVINGQIKSQKGSGSGDILIDAKGFKKSAKAETTFTFAKPVYNLDITLYPVYNEDKNKKLVFSTKNKNQGASLDSQSFVDVFGSKLEFNLKSVLGHALNGKTSIDADVTFPGQQYVAGKFVRDITTKDGIINADVSLSLEQRDNKANPGRKLTAKASNKNANIKEGIIDLAVNVVVDNSAGKNVNVDYTLKRQKKGDKYAVDSTGKITGSFLKHPLEASYNGEYKDFIGTFNFKSSCCPKSSVHVQGKYDFEGQHNPLAASVDVEVNTIFEVMSNVKATYAFSVAGPSKGKPMSIDVSSSLYTVSSNPHLNIDSKVNINAHSNKNSGDLKYHGEINKPKKIAVDVSGSYEVDPEKKTGSGNGHFKVILPENKIVEGSGSMARIAPHEYKLEAALDLPTESASFKSNKISVHTKRHDSKVNSEVQLTTNGKKYNLNSDISLKEKSPSVALKLTYPDGKTSEFIADIKKPNDARILAKLKVSCQPKDFLFEGSLDVNSESLNNFYIQVTANSPKLKIKDVLVKLGNAGSNDGKTIDITITSAGKNIVSGSATVSSREEQGKFIVEGSGNFKVENQAKSGNFKYIRTTLTSDKNGETGEEVSFDATLGNKAIDAELKMTNKEFRYLNSYCEESKQCAHIEIDAKTSNDELSRFDNEIEITIDLRVLGIPNEFGLKAVTHRENWLLDHTVDVHFENAANKYQYSVYVHPKTLGISLTTPKRIVALEGKVDLPTSNIKNGGKATGEIAFYTDKKNNPSSKSSLNGFVNVDVEKRTINAEVTLNAVGQNKPLIVKYSKTVPKLGFQTSGSEELVLDLFAKPEQKVVIGHTYSSQFNKETYKYQLDSSFVVKCPGFGVDVNGKETISLDPKAFTGTYEDSAVVTVGKNKYDTVIKMAVSPKEAYFITKYLNQILLEAKSDINLQKGLININTHTSGLGIKPIESSLEIKNYNTLKFTQYLKNDPNNKLLVTAAIIPGQIADARAEYQTGSTKKELFHVSVKLDEKNFLQPDAAVESKNIKEFSGKVKSIVIDQLKEVQAKLKEGTQSLTNDFKSIAGNVKETIPDTSKTHKFYESELNKFKEELAADKTLQEIGEILKNIFDSIASVIVKTVNTVSDIVERATVAINNAFSGIIKTIQTDILPKVKELAKEIFQIVEKIFDKLSDFVINIVAKIAEVLETLQPQLKAIAASLSEISEEVGRFIFKTYESIRKAIIEQVKHLQDELKASPLIAELKAQYNDFVKNGLPSQEIILNTVRAICGALKEIVLVPEFQNVIEQIEAYLEKKLTNKPVDDVAELEKIGRSIVEAVSKFSAALSKEAVPDILRNLRLPSLSWDSLTKLPNSIGSLRISLIEYLSKEDTTPFLTFLVRLVLVPQDFIIPGRFTGAFLGSEVITFDRRPYHFPGTCSYLAIGDALNGNFSVVVSYENKKIAGVTVTDKSGSVTIKKDKLLVNNAESDYPVNKATLHAVRVQNLIVIASTTGVKVKCEANFEGCFVEVSGYYHGQLRGLLGNANHEEYDDFVLPNGKIASTVAEVAPTYALGSPSECSAVAALEGATKQDPKCEKAFGWESPLRLCYPIVDTKIFKRSCEQSVAHGGDLKSVNAHAMYYAYLCWRSNIPVKIPTDESLKCENSLTPRKIEDEFDVKLPGKSADVLFVVSTNKNNEGLYKEYAQPLVGEIVKEFKTKGVSDVEFHLIVYGGENHKPAHVTIKGKTTFKGNAPNLKFAENPKSQKLVTGCPELDKTIGFFRNAIHEFRAGLGLEVFSETYMEAIQYPFRAEALHSVVVVTNDACESGSLLPLHVAKAILISRKDINLNIITPIKSLKVKDAKITKDVIGFNAENIITLADAKDKPTGSPVLYKDLSFDDICLETTIGVGANVFVADHFAANKNSKQQIIQTVAKNVVHQSFKRELELECTCGYSFFNPFVPHNRCRVVDLKEK